VKEGEVEGDVWGRNRKGRVGGGGREEEGRWRDRMRWDEDEMRARAEAEDCIILLLLAAAATLSPTPTRRHLFGSPALVTLHPPPSSPCFPIHFIPCPLSRLSLFPDLALSINWNRTPQSRNPHRDPGSG
jgi:hypothetical protein